MKQVFLIIVILFFSCSELRACSCSSAWNDSYSKTAEASEFVALVKVISFDSYLEKRFSNDEKMIPYSMTVEIIKKYKGEENRDRITIYGDNGMLCRPYLTDFKINGYYLVSPNPLNQSTNIEYEFFSCWTDYLEVDIKSNKAYGKYSMIRYQIDLDTFESKLKNGDWDIEIVGSIVILLILTLIIVRKIKKRNAST
ncbi:hypothetical protein [uncultured Kordia sp.]|uniref:hypothetical protein n=1 Tax=uncultured Kordia sp. TaxID=507699 RepID=UPI0026279681|nr:hypothetical protein [uncultured Kordia sp.]